MCAHVQEDEHAARLSGFLTRLAQPLVDVEALRGACLHGGVPDELREMVWKLLAGYWPPHADQREPFLSMGCPQSNTQRPR